MIQRQRRENLEEEETERVADTVRDWGRDLSSSVGDIGTLGELNDSLTGRKTLLGLGEGTRITLTNKGLVMEATSAIRRRIPPVQKNQKTLSLTAMARLGFFRPVFSLHSFSRCSL